MTGAALRLSPACARGDTEACDGLVLVLATPLLVTRLSPLVAVVPCDAPHHLVGAFCDLCRCDLATQEGRHWDCPDCGAAVPMHHACIDHWYPGPQACQACLLSPAGTTRL